VNALRISVVQYLNTAPLVRSFTHGPLRGKYQLSFTVPSQCAEDLRSGAADIAIIPAIEYQRIPNLKILPNLAIASRKSVRSLLVISKKPIREVKTFALDRTSRSTQALVRILCDRRWHITPQFFEAEPDLAAMLERADAALLIGDPALRLAIAGGANTSRGAGELLQLDVVEEWRAMTNLPAVLAVWAGRAEVITPEVVQDFQNSLAFGLRHLDEIVRESAAQTNLPVADLQRYFTENIDYGLDEENFAGLTMYYLLATQLGLIPKLQTIAITSGPCDSARNVILTTTRKQPKQAHG
jgi:chorismate dehydratase